jgi:RNA polymerase sigma factor (sigma-70 family)
MRSAGDGSRQAELGRATDGELVRLARKGHRDAWTELVHRFGPLVLGVARGNGAAPGDAADIVQSTWLLLVEHIGRIRQPDRIAAWLATTAKRQAWKLDAASTRHVLCATPPDVVHVVTAEDEIGDRLDRRRTNAALEAAIHRLPSSHRHLIGVLASDDQLSYVEVAQRVGIAIGSIGPTRQRCLATLRKSPELASIGGMRPGNSRSGDRHPPALQ